MRIRRRSHAARTRSGSCGPRRGGGAGNRRLLRLRCATMRCRGGCNARGLRRRGRMSGGCGCNLLEPPARGMRGGRGLLRGAASRRRGETRASRTGLRRSRSWGGMARGRGRLRSPMRAAGGCGGMARRCGAAAGACLGSACSPCGAFEPFALVLRHNPSLPHMPRLRCAVRRRPSPASSWRLPRDTPASWRPESAWRRWRHSWHR